jgi:hypothetical protein
MNYRNYDMNGLNPIPLTRQELREAGISLDFCKSTVPYRCNVVGCKKKKVKAKEPHYHASTWEPKVRRGVKA